MQHVFGPVPSRRLGMSLGIDLIPYKTCSYDCIYCELGKTTCKTVDRKEYVSKDLVLGQLEQYLPLLDIPPDYITLSGSGEPTLHSEICEIIAGIKRISAIPVAVITNGSLLFLDQVKEALLKADIVLPSLDAVSPLNFKCVNRPEESLNVSTIINGLIDFRKIFSNQIWLEILFCRAVNDDRAEVERMRETIEAIKPDKIQLNTVVRPSTEDFAYPLNGEQLSAIKDILGAKAEIIANIVPSEKGTHFVDTEEKILNLIARRPCTCNDLCEALALHTNETLKYLDKLKKDGRVRYTLHRHSVYYRVSNL
jgi:wyosine [tRNA(Phe)-imidazoG37] synthetase (radical SAM superfamily)